MFGKTSVIKEQYEDEKWAILEMILQKSKI